MFSYFAVELFPFSYSDNLAYKRGCRYEVDKVIADMDKACLKRVAKVCKKRIMQ